jgi:hypothetical protein
MSLIKRVELFHFDDTTMLKKVKTVDEYAPVMNKKHKRQKIR